MVGPMPMALGCLAGGREMRQVGVAIKRRGVGTSAGSGRGDDRGLTSSPGDGAPSRSPFTAGKQARRPSAVTSHQSRVSSLLTADADVGVAPPSVTPRRGLRQTGTIEGGAGARRGAHRTRNESRGSREGGSDEGGRASCRRHEARKEVEGCMSDYHCTTKQYSELCGGGRHPPTQTAHSELYCSVAR